MAFLRLYKLLNILVIILALSSCAINGNMMFKVPKDGSFKYDSIPLRPKEEYKISVDDKLTFSLSTNKGKSLIEGITGTATSIGNNNNNGGFNSNGGIINEFIVRNDGNVEVPVIGIIHIEGLTIQQCQDTMVSLFKNQYQEPFVQIRVTNRRCVVFTGNGNSASIIPLENTNTSLLEVLAKSGGISPRGKARMVKVMRKTKEKREIYLIDISTIDGLEYADMIIQGNDYIYVEPRPEILKGILTEIIPLTTLANTTLLIFSLIKKY
jgi:polysaccharide export outer membrane protein